MNETLLAAIALTDALVAKLGASPTPAQRDDAVQAVCAALREHENGQRLRQIEASVEGFGEPFCACGRRHSDCDGSRRNCHRNMPGSVAPRVQ